MKLVVRFSVIWSGVAVAVAYPRRFVSFLIPNAVTTTSSRDLTSACIETFIEVLEPTLISWDKYPIDEKIKTAFSSGTESENLPSASVEVPVVVPFTNTFTPGNPAPFSSVTFPDTIMPTASFIVSIETGK